MHYSGELLRKVRFLKNMKQTGAAKLLGISQPAYCKLERTKAITEEKWRSIMEQLGIEESEWRQVAGFSVPGKGRIA